MTPEEHRWLREQLGSLALGHLSAQEALRVRAHLDGCALCRADLAELLPLATDLRRVDLAMLDHPVTPPATLGGHIVEAVRREKALTDRRAHRRTALRAVGVAAACAALLSTGALADRALRPVKTVAAPAGPMELVTLVSLVPGVTVTRSVVIPHTWGLELQMAATGLVDGALYRGVAVGTDGSARPAGEFIGVDGKVVKCNLQAALLRDAVQRFEIVDATGDVVMRAQLT